MSGVHNLNVRLPDPSPPLKGEINVLRSLPAVFPRAFLHRNLGSSAPLPPYSVSFQKAFLSQ